MKPNDGRTAGITSPKDRSGLKERWMELSEDQLNGIEAEFIFEAQKKHLLGTVSSPRQWFNVSFLLKVHKDMLSPIWEWAGKQRNTEKNIGIKAYLISSQLGALCNDVAYWNSEPTDFTFLEQACLIHYRLAFIHPFEDGNGRFSRLIADRYLKAYGCPYPIWPDNLHQDGNARQQYINALHEADEGNFEPLLLFTQTLGARDPKLGEFLGNPFFAQQKNDDQFLMIGKALLRRGADPNDLSWRGHSPLHLAIKSGRERFAIMLMDSGAKIDIPDQSGFTALQVAKNIGNYVIAEHLLAHASRAITS